MNNDKPPSSAPSQVSTASIWRRSVLTAAASSLVLASSITAAGVMASPVSLGAIAGAVVMGLTLLSERWKSPWPLAGLGLAGVVPLAVSATPFSEREFSFYAQYFGAVFLSASAISMLYAKVARRSHEA
jgi:hypothetical protein